MLYLFRTIFSGFFSAKSLRYYSSNESCLATSLFKWMELHSRIENALIKFLQCKIISTAQNLNYYMSLCEFVLFFSRFNGRFL